jgi:hypothetical protein
VNALLSPERCPVPADRTFGANNGDCFGLPKENVGCDEAGCFEKLREGKGWLPYCGSSLELPRAEDGGRPAGVKEPADEGGGGPAGVVEGLLSPKYCLAPLLDLRSGVEGGLDEKGT